MMYQDGLAFAVKVGGKVLREVGDKDNKKVYVPFGSEYSLLIKNQKTQRALVHVSIDGQPIDNGGGFIIDGGAECEFERFVKSLDRGNKFKFIERTRKIEDGPRGVKIDDGLIRVEFQYEQRAPKIEYQDVYLRKRYHYDDTPWWRGPYYGSSGGCVRGMSSNALGAQGSSEVFYNQVTNTLSSHSVGTSTLTTSDSPENVMLANDVGITVAGSESKQQFSIGYMGTLEAEKYSMVIQIVGATEKGQVKEAFTVKHKVVCGTCGTTNKHNSKFCRECGTALEVFA